MAADRKGRGRRAGIGKYIDTADTWWYLDEPCPECGRERIATNDKVRTCGNCDWWAPVR